ncbi:ubiquitin carboxyl-terminal hydrolase [Anaeramoeba flamelloides]|uniref:Ubiquitin carboxyl-terminal hydrolase n=1 Tax=Anaeramoeba flamelloides TaxID=1746091 RepID=A0ABQ8Z753_9EUKA|nr:ubiquitin carboxyl-terminal hydrolase [Anaeramoeba flamelloides]
MNSLLQQFLMIPKFKEMLLKMNNSKNVDGKSNFLYQLQLLFAKVIKSQNSNINTLDFFNSFEFPNNHNNRNGIRDISNYESSLRNSHYNRTVQMDVYEFLNLFLNNLENNLNQKDIKKLFNLIQGEFLTKIIPFENKKKFSQKFQSFNAISLDVNYQNNLNESLDKYFKTENLIGENQFYSDQLKKKVDAKKKIYFKILPPTLIIHLKRFEWHYQSMTRNKVNSNFQFPKKIDLSKYTIDRHSEKNNKNKKSRDGDSANVSNKYTYKLFGIIVHSGQSDCGHYYSIIKNFDNSNICGMQGKQSKDKEKNKWYKFDDTNVSQFDPEKIPDVCYGGEIDSNNKKNYYSKQIHSRKKNYSAYMLFYQKIENKNTNNNNNNNKNKNNNDDDNDNDKKCDENNINLLKNNNFKQSKLHVFNKVFKDNCNYLKSYYCYDQSFQFFQNKLITKYDQEKNQLILKIIAYYFIKITAFLKNDNDLLLVDFLKKNLSSNYFVSEWLLTKLTQKSYKKLNLLFSNSVNTTFENNFFDILISIVKSFFLKIEIKNLIDTKMVSPDSFIKKTIEMFKNYNLQDLVNKISNNNNNDKNQNNKYDKENRLLISFLNHVLNSIIEPTKFCKNIFDFFNFLNKLLLLNNQIIQYCLSENVLTRLYINYSKINPNYCNGNHNQIKNHQKLNKIQISLKKNYYWFISSIETIIFYIFKNTENKKTTSLHLSNTDKFILKQKNFFSSLLEYNINDESINTIITILKEEKYF